MSEILSQENTIILASARRMAELGSEASQAKIAGKDSIADKKDIEASVILTLLQAYKNSANLSEDDKESILYDLRTAAKLDQRPTVESVINNDVRYFIIQEIQYTGVNGGENVGTGEIIYKQKVGYNLQFKTLVAGIDIELTPSADEILITSIAGVNIVSVDTSAAPIDLDFSNRKSSQFRCDNPIAGVKTWEYSNDSSAAEFVMFVEFTGTPVQTFPNNTRMNDIRWDNVAKTFSPIDPGKYKVKGEYDGTDWWLEISPAPYV